MSDLLLQAHSIWRWIVLLLVLITVLRSLFGLLSGQRWNNKDTRLLKLTRYAVFLQVTLGLLLYLARQRWLDLGLTTEHVVTALVAVGALEFGAARVRRSAGKRMYLFTLVGAGLAFILILAALQAVGGIFA